MTERICSTCGETKPLAEYHKDRRAPGGFRLQCKVCRSQQMKAWYAENQERQRDRQRDRVAADREHIRELDRRRYQRHRPERVELAKSITHQSRALAVGAGSESGITVSALRDRHGDMCCYCGGLMSFELISDRAYRPSRATVEHVLPISRGGGHTWENVRLACWSCNLDKRERTVDEWKDRPEAEAHGQGTAPDLYPASA